jgi:Raf kinase inhibitor-like YbhB/YbcL family protein
MKKNVFLTLVAFSGLFSKSFGQKPHFTLQSPDLGKWIKLEQVYDQYGCGGENISPQLYWHNAPKNTQSFAVTMFDPDAPTGKGWWHWLVFNIPNTVNELPKNAGNPEMGLLPETVVQSINDYGQYGYGGPCPPRGDKPHRYFVTVYALDVPFIDLGPDAKPELVEYYLKKHTISKAELISLYGRD